MRALNYGVVITESAEKLKALLEKATRDSQAASVFVTAQAKQGNKPGALKLPRENKCS